MKRLLQIVLSVGVIACNCIIPLIAQNNLSVTYENAAAVPDFLNICGAPDDVVITVRLDGFEAATRSSIKATLHLFSGTQFVAFDESTSSPNVILLDDSDINNPVFQLPDLSPNGTTSVRIGYSIAANCTFLDTIIANNATQVFDTWEFDYDLGNQTDLNETDATPEYRDAFAIPSFTADIENDFGPARVGDCFERQIIINNSALDGFVSELQYNNIQGSGISVVGILVNGQPLDFTESTTFDGNTLINGTITGDFFQNNTIGSNPSDGDVFFDPDETMVITEQICVMDCDEMQSFHSVSWGCYGDFCQVTSIPDFIRIGEGTANVTVENEGSVEDENAGYCSPGQTTVTFSNNGAEIDEGFAAMMDVETGIGLGSGFVLSSNGYTITGLRIAGVTLDNINSMNELNNHPLFENDPDGAGGLEDIDGDGYYDDLALGESFEVTAFYEFDCSLAQSTATNCLNDFAVSFNARVDYSDQCNERLIRLQPNFFRPANNNASFENFTDPDAFAEVDTFFISHTESRTIRNFNIDCSGEEVFVATVALPQGVQPIISETQLLKNQLTPIPLLENSIENDTLRLVFDASAISFLLGDYDLMMAFTADCSVQLGASTFPFTFELVCPPCDCRHIWFCDDLPGPQMHATSPPCDDALNCELGIQTTAFEVNRTTFGFTDNTYTTRISPQNANQKVAIPCDSVEMRIHNIVGGTPISDNIGVVVEYQNIDGTESENHTFLFDNAILRITQNGNSFDCEIDESQLSLQINGGQKTLNFNLSSCLTDLNLTLNPGDEIEFIGMFSVNPDGPFGVQFRNIPELRGYGYFLENGEQLVCDSYGANFILAKNNTVFDVPNNDDYPEGCKATNLDYRLITVNNGFSDFFPNEFRRAAAVDSIVFNYDPAILEAFTNIDVEVAIPGHPTFGNNFFNIRPISDFPPGTYVARFDTLLQVPSYNQVQSYAFNLRLTVTPACQTSNGSSLDTNGYLIAPDIYYKDRFYANFIGDGSCAEEKAESRSNTVTYTDPPTFTFTPFGVTNFLLLGDTAVWTVQHCNTSFTADAGVTWIGVEDTTFSVFVTSIEDITDPDNPENLDVQVYGNGENKYFAFAPGLLRSDGQNTISEICNIIRIKALVKNCGQTFFPVRAGWNCRPFNDPEWNPDLNTACDEQQLQLSVTPLEPFLDANIIEQPFGNPEICGTNSVTILVRNTDLGTAFNMRTRIAMPTEGATLVPGSVEIAYPSNAPFQPALIDPEIIASNPAIKIYEYPDFENLNTTLHENGLKGFNAGTPNGENEFRLRFQFETDCDFESGSLLFYNFEAVKGCGDPTNFEAGETLPIVISGTEADFSKLLDVSFSESSAVAPGGNSTLQIDITNLTNIPTDESDQLVLTLPQGVTYIGGSTLVIQPGNWLLGEPEISIDADGRQVLLWQLPIDLQQGEMASLQLDVAAPDLACDTENIEVILKTFATESLLCDEDNTVCEVETNTSTTGDGLLTLSANQGLLDFVINSAQSECAENGQEMISIEGLLQSAGTTINSNNLNIFYHYDENGNGVYDEGEEQLASFTESGQVLENVPLSFSHSFLVDIEQICGIIVRIDETAFPELCGRVELPIGQPVLQNAGDDQIFCLNEETPLEFEIGTATCSEENYEFTWIGVPPENLDFLSDVKDANPTVTVTHDGQNAQTLTYILQTDRLNCTPSFDTVTVELGITVSVESQILSVQPGESIVLTPLIVGGTSPYFWEWSPTETLDDPNAATPTASPTENTEYTFIVTDGSGCTATATFLVIIGDVITAEVNPEEATICEDQALPLSASGGTDYVWIADPDNVSDDVLNNDSIPNPIFSNGIGGNVYNFDVIVTNDTFPGFADTAQVSITVNPTPNVSAGFDQTICLGESTRLNAFITNGTAPLTYQWSPEVAADGNSDNPLVNPTENTDYILVVTDANGCVGTDTVNVTVANCDCTPPSIAGISTNPSNCGETVGQAEIQVNGEASDYNYTWSPDEGFPIGAGNIRTNLPFGAYSVTISDTNDPTCITTTNVLIQNADGPTATFTTTSAECNGIPGSVTLSPTDYNYMWEDGSDDFVRTDLAPGTYFVTFTDNEDLDCPNVMEVTIDLNNTLMAEAQFDVFPTCGESNGSVTINVSGGSGDYSFSWEGGTNTQSNLAGGIHAVTITDNAGACTLDFFFVLPDDVAHALVNDLETNDVTCFGFENGSVDFEIELEEVFVEPYDTIFADLDRNYENGAFPAGNICIVIIDGNNCIAGGECFLIEEPEPLQLNLTATPSCNNDGTISTQILGGTPPYTIDWQDLPSNNNSPDRENLTAGTYHLEITDQNGCMISSFTTVPTCLCTPALITNLEITEAGCSLSNGAANIQVEGDEADYIYNWTPNLGQSNAIGNERTALPFGGYTVEIINQDDDACSIEIEIFITNEDGPTATVSTTPAECQQSNGTAILEPSEYIYEWSDGEVGSGRMNLAAGTYFVTFTDPAAPDCPNVMPVEITLDNPLAAEITVNQQPNCGQNNGSVTITVTGGSGNYSYSWPSETNTQEGIAAGIYSITITDNDTLGCELPFIFVLTDQVAAAEIIDLETADVSCPNATDGSVNFDLNLADGFIEPATVRISNGIQVFENGSLPAGDYCMEILDGTGCVAGGECFTIGTPEPIELSFTLTPVCDEGGSIAVIVNGGNAPYTFDWDDLPGMDNPAGRTNLDLGTYQLTVTDVNGCTQIADPITLDSCAVCDIFVNMDTLILQAPNCESAAKFCFDLSAEEVERYRITDNGMVYEDNLERCQFDTMGVYTYATLLSVEGPYQVEQWTVNNTTFSGDFTTIPDLVDSMNLWDPMGNWFLSEDGPFIIGGSPNNTYSQMNVRVLSLNITSFLGYNLGFFPQDYAIPLEVGFHEVIFTDTTTGCQEVIFVDVVCTNPDTIFLTVVETMDDTLCFSTEELVGTLDTIYNDCPDSTFVTTEIYQDSCVIFTGVLEGETTACIVLCDEFEVCDTTFVVITVEEFIDDNIVDTIVIGQSVEYCFEIDSLALINPPSTIENICPELSDGEVDFELDDEFFCVTYTGVELGTDTACVQICDDLGNCDTINFYITVVDGAFITDTIFIFEDTVTVCLDEFITGTIVDIEDHCPEDNGDEVLFTIDTLTNCVTYTGIGIGKDTACIWITNDVGDMNLVTFCVTVTETTTEIIHDTIFINQTNIYCADTTELPGFIVFIDNFCPEESGEFVDFFIDPNTNCVEYTGLELGTEMACIVFCDNFGYCDTAFINVTVVEFFDPPIAVDDNAQTTRGTPVVIDVKSNDTIFGGLVGDPFILDPPLYGEAHFNLDCSVTYTPDEKFCERTDFFTYVICNPNGCDTAQVSVFIECVGVVIFNAVSPNGDGFNDVFFITGLEDKPENHLQIFNRWGNLVFETTNYRNNWDGTWDSNKELPDGTYYYIFEYQDENDETIILNGYLELFR